MDGTGGHHVKQNKPDSERQILYVFCHMSYPGKKKDHKSTRGTIWEKKGDKKEGVGGIIVGNK
jgi:hypothetical protein